LGQEKEHGKVVRIRGASRWKKKEAPRMKDLSNETWFILSGEAPGAVKIKEQLGTPDRLRKCAITSRFERMGQRKKAHASLMVGSNY